ncbi:MAG TPA: glycosyltransferase family 2 protein [Oculatellaceae cyanobacterium]
MSTSQPTVYILVLHWRGLENTRSCLASLKKLQYDSYEILLVDNGSETLDGEKLKEEFPGIHLLRLPDNKGFAGGCNAGIAYCIERTAPFIWILNNDTVIAPETLSILVAAAEKEPKAAALSAAVLDAVSPENIIPGRGVIDFRKAKSLLRPVNNNESVECDWLAASNLLLRSSALQEENKVNAFDERYFLYFEDTEICHRLRMRGWKCVFVPSARITHVGGASTGKSLQHWRSYYHTRNRFLFFSTYTKGLQRTLAMLAIRAHVLRHRLSLPQKGDDGKRQLKAELMGERDFNRGVFGQCKDLDQLT